MARCFVIQPFDRARFDKRYNDVFKPAIERVGLEPYRVDQDPAVEIPIDEIERGIRESEICLADITADNPNVWYEVGFAFAARKPVCLVCADERQKYPFDIQHRRVLGYKSESSSDFDDLRDRIAVRLGALLEKAAQLESLAEAQPLARTAGRTPAEMAALCVLSERDMYQDGTATGKDIVLAMEGAGFTPTATSLALAALLEDDFVAFEFRNEEWGGQFKAFTITSQGRRWLVANQDRLNLRRRSDRATRKPHAGFEESDPPS